MNARMLHEAQRELDHALEAEEMGEDFGAQIKSKFKGGGWR
jgi:hypothetical protein